MTEEQSTTTKFIGDIVFNNGEADVSASDLVTVNEVNEALKSYVKSDLITNDGRGLIPLTPNENENESPYVEITWDEQPTPLIIKGTNKSTGIDISDTYIYGNYKASGELYYYNADRSKGLIFITSMKEIFDIDYNEVVITSIFTNGPLTDENKSKCIPTVSRVEKMINKVNDVGSLIDIPIIESDEMYKIGFTRENYPSKVYVEAPEKCKGCYTWNDSINDLNTFEWDCVIDSKAYQLIATDIDSVLTDVIYVWDPTDEYFDLTNGLVVKYEKALTDDDKRSCVPTVSCVESMIPEIDNSNDVSSFMDPSGFEGSDDRLITSAAVMTLFHSLSDRIKALENK